MSLTRGTTLGPYEIVGALGAGGMGEVYRARDPRLGREVAIKVLPRSMAGNPDRQRRFETEARAAARLNHPNILQIYDVGEHDGQPYLVTELLEGETLRERMDGAALPVRKAIELAIPMAYGLGAAHEQGIVHRDLKPENLFVTRDGRVKILDFGLAKLLEPDVSDAKTTAPTMAADTAAGLVLGTVGYMSPEQVRGQPADERSDIFAFGSILYEMVAGTRAFKGDSAADTMSAILREDPPELATASREIPPVVERIVRHCLEKSPAQRFRSAHDLAFQLEAISTLSSGGAVAAIDGGARRESVRFARQTYQRGLVASARFATDGHSVVYGAAWDGNPTRLFMKRPESPDSIPLALPNADILAISATGEMAIQLDPQIAFNGSWIGTLALAPMFGGAPREIVEDVIRADFGPNGEDLAVARYAGRTYRLEYPLDHLLHESTNAVSYVRVSPDGERVAFFDHPLPGDDRGLLAVVDRHGQVSRLTDIWPSIQGLAWSPSGDEIWFTAAEMGSGRSLHAARLSGELRCVSGFPSSVKLFDIAKDGRVLMASDHARVGILAKAPGESHERDLTWLDWSLQAGLSADGKTMLFDESNAEVGPNYIACLRKTDGSPVVRLTEGGACGLSPDGRWALTRLPQPGSPLIVVPVGPGRKRTMDSRGIEGRFAYWLPDNRRFVWVGPGPDGKKRAVVLDRESDDAVTLALEHEGRTRGVAVSPDGSFAVFGIGSETRIVPLDGGPSQRGPAIDPGRGSLGVDVGERVIGMSSDGQWLWVAKTTPKSLVVDRIHMETDERQPWMELQPADPSGIVRLGDPRIVLDGEAYCYFFARILSQLYVATGLR